MLPGTVYMHLSTLMQNFAWLLLLVILYSKPFATKRLMVDKSLPVPGSRI